MVGLVVDACFLDPPAPCAMARRRLQTCRHEFRMREYAALARWRTWPHEAREDHPGQRSLCNFPPTAVDAEALVRVLLPVCVTRGMVLSRPAYRDARPPPMLRDMSGLSRRPKLVACWICVDQLDARDWCAILRIQYRLLAMVLWRA